MLRPYPSTYWFCFTEWQLAEFAVLLEGSDHIFKPYPVIRRLGRLLTLFICSILFFIFVVPSLAQHRPSSLTMLDLVKSASLTKAVLIVVLLAAARLYRLPLGKNISGMMLGFTTYLALNMSNMALAEGYGPAVYAKIFAVVGPVSFVLALTIWTVCLWRSEPVLPGGRDFYRRAENTSETLADELGRYNSELARLFRR